MGRHALLGPAAMILLAVSSRAAPAPVRSAELVEAAAFLEEYRAASEAQRIEFYDLYSDRAIVHARIQAREQGVAFQGRAFKAWGRQLLNEGRGAPDGSRFREATVEQRGSRLLIRARRYSTAHCYWDLGYQVGIELEGSAYRIVDERLTTSPTSRCTTQRPVASTSPSVGSGAGLTQPIVQAWAIDPILESPWHPLSEHELADQALRMAQRVTAARAAAPGSAGLRVLSASDAAMAPTDSVTGTAAVAVRAHIGESNNVWQTPQE